MNSASEIAASIAAASAAATIAAAPLAVEVRTRFERVELGGTARVFEGAIPTVATDGVEEGTVEVEAKVDEEDESEGFGGLSIVGVDCFAEGDRDRARVRDAMTEM